MLAGLELGLILLAPQPVPLAQRPVEPSATPIDEEFKAFFLKLQLVAVRLDQVALDVPTLVNPVGANFPYQIFLAELPLGALSAFELEWTLAVGALGISCLS